MSTHNIGFYEEISKQYPLIIIKYAPYLLICEGGCTEETWQRQYEVLANDRKKFGIDTADPQNRSEWRGHLSRKTCQTSPPPLVEDTGL